MNKTYCSLPFRETMVIPGNELILCRRHDDTVAMGENFDQTFKSGKFLEIRELMLEGKTVSGCEQCYREEANGIESLREQSIKKYGVVDDIEIQGLHIQFDNLCNLKCRMCASPSSHLLYESEINVLGRPIAKQKFQVTDKYNEIDISKLTEVRLHGGEPFLSKRVESFFNKLATTNKISNISVHIPTNGTIKPSNDLLAILMQCKSLFIWVSIDAYGKLNNYFRSKSEFDTIIDNLDFFYSLIDKRPTDSTTIGVTTTINIYNVNKLEKLDAFLKTRYPNLKFNKSILHNPDYLRISCMPIEYKNKIQHTLVNYPEILKILNVNDNECFDEFIFYHNKLDIERQETLGDLNLELSEFINSYTPKRTITTENILKFFENILK